MFILTTLLIAIDAELNRLELVKLVGLVKSLPRLLLRKPIKISILGIKSSRERILLDCRERDTSKTEASK